MSLYITGDTHGNFSRLSHKNLNKMFPPKKKWTEDDIIIIAGDFGGVWAIPGSHYYTKENRMLDKISKDYKCKILFIDGNHENHGRLQSDEFKTMNMFDGEVSQIRNNIFYLHRGEIYNINGKKIFVMGGATSIDKENRTEFISWWRQEIPNYGEFEKGMKNLEKHNYEVDYMITHTAPLQGLKDLGIWHRNLFTYYESCPVVSYFDTLLERGLKFNRWFFGHWHENLITYKYNCLYDSIMEI